LDKQDLRKLNRILVVDDEPAIVELVSYNLRAEGYLVDFVTNGREAIAHALRNPPNLVLLDLMMPEIPGLTVAQRLRENDLTRRIPIIMLTARGENTDQIAGFRAGADDYITKPFSMDLLLARVEAVLRRAQLDEAEAQVGQLVLGPIRVNPDTFEAWCEKELMHLTATEFRMLAALIGSHERVLSRRDLIGVSMGPGVTITERTIDVHVTAIRRKLGKHGGMIRTVRGVGYRAAVDEPDDL
jgi:two-component system, OmpR family, phosphate regulon response regulator PhoB